MHFLFHIVLILYIELVQLVTKSESVAWSLTQWHINCSNSCKHMGESN